MEIITERRAGSDKDGNIAGRRRQNYSKEPQQEPQQASKIRMLAVCGLTCNGWFVVI